MKRSYIIDGMGNVNVYWNEEHFMISYNSPIKAQALEYLQCGSDLEEFRSIVDIKTMIDQKFGFLELKGGQLYYNGYPLNNGFSAKFLELLSNNESVEGLVKFFNRLAHNPSQVAVNELFDFLALVNIPINKDGHIYAYKAVRKDYYDLYSGTILNSVGKVIEMPRNMVDDDRNRGCSRGLHVGAFDYAVRYGGSNAKMLVCEVDPADVVSIPHDCSYQKMRTCRYKVVAILDMPLNNAYHHDYEEDEWYEDMDCDYEGYEDEDSSDDQWWIETKY